MGVIAVLLLWIWPGFSNFFSTFYLDGPSLLFGSLFLYFLFEALIKPQLWKGFLSGVAFAALVMTKGLLCLGFLPIACGLVLVALHVKGVSFSFSKKDLGPLWEFFKTRFQVLLLVKLSFFAVFAFYVWAVLQSQVPEFFEIYWTRQMTSRFGRIWSWGQTFGMNFWSVLLKSAFYFPLLVPLFFVKSRRKPLYFIPLLSLATFVAMFAPAFRVGGQYNLFLMPSLAWMLALGVDEFLDSQKYRIGGFFDLRNLRAESLQKGSQFLALSLVVIIQYLPT